MWLTCHTNLHIPGTERNRERGTHCTHTQSHLHIDYIHYHSQSAGGRLLLVLRGVWIQLLWWVGGPRQDNDRVRTMYVKLYVIKFETDSTIKQKWSRVKGDWEELRVLHLNALENRICNRSLGPTQVPRTSLHCERCSFYIINKDSLIWTQICRIHDLNKSHFCLHSFSAIQ